MLKRRLWATIAGLSTVFFAAGLPAAQAPAIVFDFESGDLQGWEVTEGRFDKLVCDRQYEFHHQVPYTKQGQYYLSTLERADGDRPDDGFTGVVESPVFVIAGAEATLRVGGGAHPETYVALCLADGQEVLRARGAGSQTMNRVSWDTSAWVGKPAFLRVVDRHTGGWGHITFDDFFAEGHIDAQATEARAVARQRARQVEVLAPIRLAIEDLANTLGSGYPNSAEYLTRLDKAGLDGAEIEALRREALVANELVSGQPLLFVARPQYRSDHHNTATMFQTGEINQGSFAGGSAIKTIDLATADVTALLEVPDGIARDPDVRWDGQRILFAMRRNAQDDYHLYEMNADGSELKQLTFGSGLSDIDPIYLPDGRVMFTSTREPKYCMCNRHIMGNLFTMNADGSNIQQIGHSTLHEGHAAMLPDGRVIYDRWEYVDRNFGDAQGVWVTNPDGTNHAVYWGNNTASPGAVLDARPIPGSERFIATFSSCHDRPWGALAIVDRRRGLDGREPVVRTWPAAAIERVGKGNYDAFTSVTPKYEDPYPLSEKYFLCSRTTGAGEQMGLYLVDVFGNEILLHAEQPGCYDPMPLVARTKPRAIPERIDLAKQEGVFRVENVYIGSGMDQVQPGSVKFLRVVESPEKRFWTGPAWDGGTGQQAPGMAWDDFNNKRILGTVPVDENGSTAFEVPADTFVYFQLLDENGMTVQSMRSGTIVRPGEVIGCVGCHEDRRSTGQWAYPSGGSLQPVHPLRPWYGPARLFSYAAEVQPVFDKHCVSCHDYGQPAGEKLNLAGDLGLVFNTSYVQLRSKGYVRVVGAGPADVQLPMSWGSHASPLAKRLLAGNGHPEMDCQMQLDPESFDRIITWIDINAPYYSDYAGGAYRDNPYGRAPLTAGELKQFSDLVGGKATNGRFDEISFTRPELSPCLSGLKEQNPAKYQEALAIIRLGKQRLDAQPRLDMPGCEMVAPVEIAQQQKYEMRLEQEAQMRAAIVGGQRLLTSAPDQEAAGNAQ